MGTLNITTPTGVFSLDPNLRSDGLTTEGWACNEFGAFVGSTDNDLIAGLLGPTKSLVYYQVGSGVEKTVTATFNFNNTDPIFELDGNPAITGNALPPGFLMSLTQILNFSVASLRPGPFTYANSLECRFTESNAVGAGIFNLDITQDGLINSSQFTTAVLIVSGKIMDYPVVAAPITAISFSGFDLSGTYTLESFQFSFSPSTASIGDTITISNDTTPDPTIHPNLLDITSITLQWADGSLDISTDLFITWTYLIITFILPPEVGTDQNVTVVVNIASTEFTGSVTLGTLAVNVEPDHSGIYTLVTNKRNDTLYNQDDGGTNDYMIPTPIFKIGPIGG